MKKELLVVGAIVAVAAIFAKTTRDSDNAGHKVPDMRWGCSHPSTPIGF